MPDGACLARLQNQNPIPDLVYVSCLMVLNILHNYLFVTVKRSCIVATDQEILSDEIPIFSEIIPHNLDCALALDVSHNQRNTVLRLNDDRYVHIFQYIIRESVFLFRKRIRETVYLTLHTVLQYLFFLYLLINFIYYFHYHNICARLSSVKYNVFFNCSWFG